MLSTNTGQPRRQGSLDRWFPTVVPQPDAVEGYDVQIFKVALSILLPSCIALLHAGETSADAVLCGLEGEANGTVESPPGHVGSRVGIMT